MTRRVVFWTALLLVVAIGLLAAVWLGSGSGGSGTTTLQLQTTR